MPAVDLLEVAGDVAFKLVADAVIPLADHHLGGHPMRAEQAGVAELGRPYLIAGLAKSMSGEIRPAELQKLWAINEAAPVAGWDRERDDRTYPGHLERW